MITTDHKKICREIKRMFIMSYILELKYLKYKINPFPPKILQHLLAHFTESANVQCLCIYLLYIPYIKHLTVVIYFVHLSPH